MNGLHVVAGVGLLADSARAFARFYYYCPHLDLA